MAPPRIHDPRAIPVVGRDTHLPAVAPERLNAPALRRRFAERDALVWQPEFTGDGRIGADRAPAHASVLIPLVEHAGDLHVLLTRRTDHLRDHAGQVSFPGGRAEPEDADAADTALREAHEEVGLPRSQVDVIGHMPTYTTVTNFVVTPVVALVRPPFKLADLAIDGFEVAEAFHVPLSFLMNPANHQRHVFDFDGGQRQFLSMPWQGAAADGKPREYFIWGATAAMLRNLYRYLSL
jgi:8-oxo-dGTP pyrophosphatase MutT (NUDIX family)